MLVNNPITDSIIRSNLMFRLNSSLGKKFNWSSAVKWLDLLFLSSYVILGCDYIGLKLLLLVHKHNLCFTSSKRCHDANEDIG